MSGIEYCPKINGYIDVDECNKCEHLGLSRWSMKPICRHEPREAHPSDKTCNLCGNAECPYPTDAEFRQKAESTPRWQNNKDCWMPIEDPPPDEIVQTIQRVRDTSENPEVKRIMSRALEAYSKQPSLDTGLTTASSVLLQEMAALEKAERTHLWIGPIATLVATGILFVILKAFISGL